jgi:Protein of unknown function (DUF541)
MQRLHVALLFAASAAFSFAQLDDNTLTVTAGKFTSLTPDQASVMVTVAMERSAGLDDALAILKDSGFAASNLLNVISYLAPEDSDGSPSVDQWSFVAYIPLEKLKTVLTALSQAQAVLVKQNSGRGLYFSSSSGVSDQAFASQPCSLDALIADAKDQARLLASAGGVSVGGILSISDGSGFSVSPVIVSNSAGTPSPGYPFFGGLNLINQILTTPRSLPPFPQGCTVNVQFKLLH